MNKEKIKDQLHELHIELAYIRGMLENVSNQMQELRQGSGEPSKQDQVLRVSESYEHPWHQHIREGSISNRVSIDKRPDVANDRKRIGDIETDLVVSPKNQGSSIVSSVDRLSRFCCLDKVANKTKESVSEIVVRGLSNIGFDILTITTDNGTVLAQSDNVLF